jgi:hypothetical protein
MWFRLFRTWKYMNYSENETLNICSYPIVTAENAGALLAACFVLVYCVAYSSTLKMDTSSSSEMSCFFSDIHSIKTQKTTIFERKSLVTTESLQMYSFKPRNFTMLLVKIDFSFHQTLLVLYLFVFPVML